MNCEKCKNIMMDVLYEEINEEKTLHSFFAHIEKCTSCDKTWKGFKTTRSFINAWKDEKSSNTNPVIIIPHRKRLISKKRIRKLIPVAAVIFFALSILLVFSGIKMSYREGVLVVNFRTHMQGESVVAEKYSNQVKRLIAESEERQMQQMMNLLQNVYFKVEEERLSDRQSIRQGFDLIKQIYMDQIEKNNKLLELSLKRVKNDSFQR